jgi:glycine reductase
MALTFEKLLVRSAEFASATGFEDGALKVARSELCERLAAGDRRIERVDVHIALPGQATRVLCAKDVVQPRCKPEGTEPGEGKTLVLEDAAVVTCGPIVGFQEGIIDMSGPGAAYSPFSAMVLIVLEIGVRDGTQPHAHEEVLRRAGLDAAEWLARSCEESAPERRETFRWDEVSGDANLPRIAYLDMILTQGLLHDSWVLGEYAGDVLPCTLDPRVVIDTGIVSGNCVSACDKTTTWHHQNNPLVYELLAGHGERWNFVGVVLTKAPTRLGEKQEAARRAVGLVEELGAEGVVISKEGFGNPDADLMMLIRGLAATGIRTVAITDEFAGPDGASQSLADIAPEADALVSVGNANERVVLPPMRTVIGPVPDVARLAGGYAQSVHEDGTMEIELQAIVGATNQLGFSPLSCRSV